MADVQLATLGQDAVGGQQIARRSVKASAGGALYSPISMLNVGVYQLFFNKSTDSAAEFAINLYDSAWRVRSNRPVPSNRLLHYPLAVNHPMNHYPAPPILYPVSAVIRFDIFSLIPSGDTLPQINLSFAGIRRIRCR